MQIISKGHACFQIITAKNKGEQVKIVIDPFDAETGLKLSPLEADIGLITHDHHDHNNVKALKGEPFLAKGPGEYDIKDVSIRGIDSFHDDAKGEERGKNTIYVIETEGISLCHLGDFGQHELTSEQVEDIGNIDILFIPVGGVFTIGAKEAVKIISQIEPRYVIPMHYQEPKLKEKLESVDEFVKVIGAKPEQAESKFTIKAKDLSGEDTKVLVMKS